MHDPSTVAFEIKYPWYRYKPWPKKFRKDPSSWGRKMAWEKMSPAQQAGRAAFWRDGYRETFITIWHVDPERDGTDDSCGYSYVRLTKRQIERLHDAARGEGRVPHFLCCPAKEWTGTHSDAESLYRGLVFLVCRVLRLPITFEQAAKYASEAIHGTDVMKYGGQFCFLPGYHTNSLKDSADDRQRHFEGILCGVARMILTDRRPWWKHPKRHFWHWKFQCHPLQQFKRWAFSRCCKCGKRFKWGYSPTTNNWNSGGPRWFRSETDTFHLECDDTVKVRTE